MSPPSPGDPCDGTAELLEGDSLDIFSPNYGLGEYPLDATCVWHLQVECILYESMHFFFINNIMIIFIVGVFVRVFVL